MLPPLALTETCTPVLLPTGLVTRVKFAVVPPASTVTLAGIELTAAAPLTTKIETTVLVATGTGNASFPVLLEPPVTVAGWKKKEVGTLGLTVSVPLLLPLLAVAEITTLVATETGLVRTVKVAVVAPASTVTVLGMEAIAEPPLTMLSATGVFTLTARPNVTFPVVLPPP